MFHMNIVLLHVKRARVNMIEQQPPIYHAGDLATLALVRAAILKGLRERSGSVPEAGSGARAQQKTPAGHRGVLGQRGRLSVERDTHLTSDPRPTDGVASGCDPLARLGR